MIEVLEVLKIIQHILWIVSAFWFGYEIGKQHMCTELMKKDMEELKEKTKKWEK